jgi:hypothetical protein
MTAAFFLKILLVTSMIATVGVLVLGLFNLFKEDKATEARSNKIMRWRILFQAFAIFIFSLILFFKVK